MTFTDGYGNSINRQGACYNSKTVIVTITDACPCNYPSNNYSNRRWCCGDMRGMDLSREAFAQLADTSIGAIGIQFRPVSCDASSSSASSSSSSLGGISSSAVSASSLLSGGGGSSSSSSSSSSDRSSSSSSLSSGGSSSSSGSGSSPSG
ncbi:MAG: hypothetical protein WDW36_008440 [Sanguina aurantia]